jgi:urease accessory protein
LPLLTAAYREPARLAELDELADAFLTNVVANRASRMQGRAFLSTCARVWPTPALSRLELEHTDGCGHAAPITGAVMREMQVGLDTAQRLILYNSARGVLAAAVRLGIIGSYDAQRLQFDSGPVLDMVVDRCGALDDTSLAQTAPIVDLLQASHDRLYSRLFQS